MNWKTLTEQIPLSNTVISIKVGTSTYYGVRKDIQWFKIVPIRDEACRCVTGHRLEEVPKAMIDTWSMPTYPERMNDIYEELLD